MAEKTNNTRKYIVRITFIILIILAIFLVRYVMSIYVFSRDSFLYANVVDVNSQIAGPVEYIYVHDNQHVDKGQKLFAIDAKPYEFAYQQAQAELQSAELESTPAVQNLATAKSKIVIATATQHVNKAKYDLEHTTIYAPASGYISNFLMRPGNFVQQGQTVFALVEDGGWWVITRYRESTLRHMQVGDKAYVLIDMYPRHIFHGVVQSISWGINRLQASPTAAPSGLPYIQSTEYWIRIAERFHVWIKITDPDLDRYPLRVGASAKTVVIAEKKNKDKRL